MNKFTMDWDRFARISRQAAAEGAVLLKNEGQALPIRKGEAVSVFGRIQLDYYKSGTGSGGLVNTRYVAGILDALKSHPGITLDQELLSVYEAWTKEHPFQTGAGWAGEPWSQEEMPLSDSLVSEAAARSDLALVIIGRTAGEDRDNMAEKGSYLLSDPEEDMLQKVCRYFKRVAVVLNTGNIIDMKWMNVYQPSAVLYVWHGGQEGGNAVVDVLTGEVTPCGKLTDTIAFDIADYPSSANFGSKTRNVYTEDIYVGYRFFETFARDKVMYPFGFGLSYTSFQLETTAFHIPDTADLTGKSVEISVKVRNTGSVKGKEVVQVYVSAPQGKLGKPARELKAFAKTSELMPGESELLTLTVPVESLASYDDSGITGRKSCYVLEAGSYVFYAGSDVRTAVQAGALAVDSLLVTEQLEEALAPVRAFRRFRAVDQNGALTLGEEDTPLRSVNLQARIRERRPTELPFTGDMGYRLGDVYDGKVSMEDFLAQLSDEDFIHMTRGEGMCSPKVTPGTAGAFGGLTDRLLHYGIPVGCCADGPSGIRMDCGSYAFSLPNGTCLASSFNTELVKELYVIEGLELRKNRIDTLLGPGVNIHRNPLNGRNFEYFSEDPLLTGKMGAACLLGMHEYGVTGTAKHFAANNQELGRHTSDSVVSERALREIYLKGFEILVKEGNARSIMSAYGSINGIWAAGNYDLMTTVLRREWGYKGIVMTDWWAAINEDGEKVPSTANTHYMVRAQNDIYMVVVDSQSNSSGDLTEEGLRKGIISRGELARNAANICNALMNLPVMDRSLGRMSEDEKAASEKAQQEDHLAFDLPYQVIGKNSTLDLSGLKTDKGTSALFALSFAERGHYDITLKMKCNAGELAQIPVTLFLNRNLLATITINGTGGKWVEETRDLGRIFLQNAYLQLYFAQSGMEIEEIRISMRAPFDEEAFRLSMTVAEEE
ncbi:beta-glucosidase [Anaerotaenia torta]|uniref:glycoside hydrolase family 3 protein n=1 Tax=Anaerotaenia torta TaxID=433293 RepID=UPI003D1BBC51